MFVAGGRSDGVVGDRNSSFATKFLRQQSVPGERRRPDRITASFNRNRPAEKAKKRRSEASAAPRRSGQARQRNQPPQPEYLDDYGDDYADDDSGYDDPWNNLNPAAYGQMPGATLPAAPAAAPQVRGSGSAPPPHPAPRSSGIQLGAVLAGGGMMVGAVVWFVAGLAGGVIFFYPPVLLVIGLVTMVKGFFGGE